MQEHWHGFFFPWEGGSIFTNPGAGPALARSACVACKASCGQGAALEECNKVLEVEKANVKALLRRGKAYGQPMPLDR